MNPDLPEEGDDLFVCPVCRREAWGDWEHALRISEDPFTCPACGDINRGTWRKAIRGAQEDFWESDKQKDTKIARLESTVVMLGAFLFFAVATIMVMRGC
jgi:hypothetical protein